MKLPSLKLPSLKLPSLKLTASATIIGAFCSAIPAQGAIPPAVIEPSFDCNAALDGSIEAVICASDELRILDRTVGQKLEHAQSETPRAKWPELLAEQDSFLANRNLCMDVGEERHDCIAFAYESRLQRLEDWISGEAWAE
jgi:uncharacterized protein